MKMKNIFLNTKNAKIAEIIKIGIAIPIKYSSLGGLCVAEFVCQLYTEKQ